MTGPMRYIAKRIAEKYRKMSIQRVISLFFTIVTALGMIFMGATLFFRFPTRWRRCLPTAPKGCFPK